MNAEDMVGLEFGYWTVLGVATPRKDNRGHSIIMLHCKCRCGTEKDVMKVSILNGKSTSCGCYHRDCMHEIMHHDIIGERFGHLVVVAESGRRNRAIVWKCKCDCGNYTDATTADLRRGHKISCGCYHQSIITTHGGSKDRLYQIWLGMRRRCYDSKLVEWPYYGGRGISVCDEWFNDYTSFKTWALSSGYNNNLTLDRIDFNGNYSPDNCRWITSHDQCRNTRYNRRETIGDETKTVVEWCEQYGIPINKRGMVYKRLSRGWPIDRALFEPSHRA